MEVETKRLERENEQLAEELAFLKAQLLSYQSMHKDLENINNNNNSNNTSQSNSNKSEGSTLNYYKEKLIHLYKSQQQSSSSKGKEKQIMDSNNNNRSNNNNNNTSSIDYEKLTQNLPEYHHCKLNNETFTINFRSTLGSTPSSSSSTSTPHPSSIRIKYLPAQPLPANSLSDQIFHLTLTLTLHPEYSPSLISDLNILFSSLPIPPPSIQLQSESQILTVSFQLSDRKFINHISNYFNLFNFSRLESTILFSENPGSISTSLHSSDNLQVVFSLFAQFQRSAIEYLRVLEGDGVEEGLASNRTEVGDLLQLLKSISSLHFDFNLVQFTNIVSVLFLNAKPSSKKRFGEDDGEEEQEVPLGGWRELRNTIGEWGKKGDWRVEEEGVNAGEMYGRVKEGLKGVERVRMQCGGDVIEVECEAFDLWEVFPSRDEMGI